MGLGLGLGWGWASGARGAIATAALGTARGERRLTWPVCRFGMAWVRSGSLWDCLGAALGMACVRPETFPKTSPKSGPKHAKKSSFCHPSVVKKNGNRPRRPTNPSNANTTTVLIFNVIAFSWTNPRESREDNIENENACCVCVGRQDRFPFFFTTDGPKSR